MPPFLIIGAFLKCAIAKIGFEKNKVSHGFEALARAQCLLKSKISLGKMTLLSQVILISRKHLLGSVCNMHLSIAFGVGLVVSKVS